MILFLVAEIQLLSRLKFGGNFIRADSPDGKKEFRKGIYSFVSYLPLEICWSSKERTRETSRSPRKGRWLRWVLLKNLIHYLQLWSLVSVPDWSPWSGRRSLSHRFIGAGVWLIGCWMFAINKYNGNLKLYTYKSQLGSKRIMDRVQTIRNRPSQTEAGRSARSLRLSTRLIVKGKNIISRVPNLQLNGTEEWYKYKQFLSRGVSHLKSNHIINLFVKLKKNHLNHKRFANRIT